MDKIEREIVERLNSGGATLIRQTNEAVYRFPDGRIFVRPKTPGDWRSNRNSLAQLRRRRADKPNSAANEGREESPEVAQTTVAKKRYTAPPRDPPFQPDINFRLTISSGQRIDNSSAARSPRRLISLMDLMGELETLDEFWRLKTSGRIALLKGFISDFAKPETILVRFGRIDVVKSPGHSDQASVVKRLIQSFSLPTLQGHQRDWKQGGFESLHVNDPELGGVVVDVCGSRFVGGRDDIVIIPAEFDTEGRQITYWPVWLSETPAVEQWDQHFPDRFIGYAFYNRLGSKKYGIENFSAFSNKAQTRDAVRALSHRLSASDANCADEAG